MSEQSPKRDLLVLLSEYIAQHRGMPVLIGIGFVLLGLVLAVIPGAGMAVGFLGWMARTHVLLYIGVIVGLLGILLGDAL